VAFTRHRNDRYIRRWVRGKRAADGLVDSSLHDVVFFSKLSTFASCVRQRFCLRTDCNDKIIRVAVLTSSVNNPASARMDLFARLPSLLPHRAPFRLEGRAVSIELTDHIRCA
jgi:hypothetical protein